MFFHSLCFPKTQEDLKLLASKRIGGVSIGRHGASGCFSEKQKKKAKQEMFRKARVHQF